MTNEMIAAATAAAHATLGEVAEHVRPAAASIWTSLASAAERAAAR